MISEKIKKVVMISSYIILSVLFAIPSLIWILQNKTIYGFRSTFKYLLTDNINRIEQMLVFLIIFSAISIMYLIILKNYKKIFQNVKQIIMFIIVITAIFSFTLPFTSSDIFYYIRYRLA